MVAAQPDTTSITPLASYEIKVSPDFRLASKNTFLHVEDDSEEDDVFSCHSLRRIASAPAASFALAHELAASFLQAAASEQAPRLRLHLPPPSLLTSCAASDGNNASRECAQTEDVRWATICEACGSRSAFMLELLKERCFKTSASVSTQTDSSLGDASPLTSPSASASSQGFERIRLGSEASSAASSTMKWADVEDYMPPLTSVILRNLPEALCRDQLVDLLRNEGFFDAVDFVYLPQKLDLSRNFGYAFLNFASHERARDFFVHFQGRGFAAQSEAKETAVEWCEFQGLDPLVERYRNSPLMHASVADAAKPALFGCADGKQRLPFPAPTKALKPPRRNR